jgi:hypothetical protein
VAKVRELDEAAWAKWVATRPECVQELCRLLPPDRLYKMKSTGQRVTLHSYSEDGTVTVDVTADYNFLTFERQVFGISADDLEECDLPGPSELTGALLTEPEEIEEFGEAWRAAQRTT